MTTLHIVVLDYAAAAVVFHTVTQEFLDTWFGGYVEYYIFADKESYGLGYKCDEIDWMCAPSIRVEGEM